MGKAAEVMRQIADQIRAHGHVVEYTDADRGRTFPPPAVRKSRSKDAPEKAARQAPRKRVQNRAAGSRGGKS